MNGKNQGAHSACEARIDEALKRHDKLLDRIEQFAATHAPKMDSRLSTETRSSRGAYADTALLWCQECRAPWPCNSYLWATQSEPFKVVIRPVGDESQWGLLGGKGGQAA